MKYIGLLSSAASGKLGGVVASHNRSGDYFRHHSIPVQPRTPAQLAQRNALAAFSSAFRALTAAQVAGWNSLGSTVTLKNALGISFNPTGQQLFVSCNRNLASIGVSSILTTAPSVPSFPAISSFTITPQTPGATVTAFDYTVSPALPSNFGVLVRASSVQTTGRTFVGKSLYRTLKSYNPASGAASSFFSIFTSRFGPLPQSGNISFAIKLIDPASGFAGTEVTALTTFSQPSGTNLFTVTATSETLSNGTGSKAIPVTLTDTGSFDGAVYWTVLDLPAGATFTVSANPSSTAPTVTVLGSTVTVGAYSCSVQASYGTFTTAAAFTLTVTA